jgi:translation initiation factor IF-3
LTPYPSNNNSPNSGPPSGGGGFNPNFNRDRAPGGPGGGGFNRDRSNFKYKHRINDRIRMREVLTIGPDGKSLGVLPIEKALSVAKEHGLDLVEIGPTARPPVCKIVDYGKFRYEESKREKEARKHNHSIKLKELKLHITTDAHDYMVRMKHAEKFLFKGMKAKILVVLRGREMQQKDLAGQMMIRIKNDLAHIGIPDSPPKLLGRNYSMLLSPLAEAKRVRKYTAAHDVDDDDDEDTDTDSDEGDSEDTDK